MCIKIFLIRFGNIYLVVKIVLIDPSKYNEYLQFLSTHKNEIQAHIRLKTLLTFLIIKYLKYQFQSKLTTTKSQFFL